MFSLFNFHHNFYIANVDSDDTVHPDKFAFEIEELEKENSGGFKYWGYGTDFTRLFYKGTIDNIIRRSEINNEVIFTCYRRLFNYMGYYHNSRYGADPDYFITRARFYNYKFYANHTKNYYYALSTAKKNLSRTYTLNFIKNYYISMKNNYRNHLYVDMALLDDTTEFARLFIHT